MKESKNLTNPESLSKLQLHSSKSAINKKLGPRHKYQLQNTQDLGRRNFIDNQIAKTIQGGQLQDLYLIRELMKSKYQKYQNHDLVKEAFYRQKISQINSAVKEIKAQFLNVVRNHQQQKLR